MMFVFKGRLAPKNQKIIFFVSNDTMKGPESRKKYFFNYENLCHCENHPLCHPDQRVNFKWARGARFT